MGNMQTGWITLSGQLCGFVNMSIATAGYVVVCIKSILVWLNWLVSTIGPTKRGPHRGYNWKYMEVDGPCHVLPDRCSHVS